MKLPNFRGRLTTQPVSLLVFWATVFPVSFTVGRGLSAGINPLFNLLIIVVVYFILRLFSLYPLLLLVVAVLTILVGVFLAVFKGAWLALGLNTVQTLLANLVDYFRAIDELHDEYLFILWLASTVLICCFSYLVLLKRLSVLVLIIPYASILLVYWYSGFTIAWPMLILLFLVLWYWIGLHKQAAGGKSGTGNEAVSRCWKKNSVLFAFVISALALLLPTFPELNPWLARLSALFGGYVSSESNGVNQAGRLGTIETGVFSLSQTGFQMQSEQLGGPVELNGRLVMELEAPFPLYLRGATRSVYSGNRWLNQDGPIEIKATNQVIDEGMLDGKVVTLELTVSQAGQRSIFSSFEAVGITSERLHTYERDLEGNISFPVSLLSAEHYQVQILIPSGQAAGLVLVQRIVGPLLESERQRYLQVPSGLPDRVSQLATELTRLATSPTAAAQAVLEYLRSSFGYALDTEMTPPGREFVDYFLFDTQKGYCTYFATTLAILLRVVGIPTRYVEGYLARSPEELDETLYLVRQSDAHAWVEAYLEPHGWVLLEPTPLYPLPDYSDRRSAREMPDLETLLASRPAMRPVLGKALLVSSLRIVVFTLIGGFLVLFVPLRIMITFRQIRRYEHSLLQLPESIAFLARFGRLLHLMALSGLAIGGGETVREFALRASANSLLEVESLKVLAENFEAVLYGNCPVVPESKIVLQRYLIFFRDSLKARHGLPAYIWSGYVVGRLRWL